MRTLKLILAIILIIVLTSCGGATDRNELAKLKKQQAMISERIKALEKSGEPEQTVLLDSLKFRFVGISEVVPDEFDHYIKVQGKLDGDQNASVFAEMPGTITEIYLNVGQNVSRGQVMAQIDDQQFRKQLESLETQYKLAADLYMKQQRLWDQKIGSEVQYLQSKAAKESFEQQISGLKEQIEKYRIKSPIDGTIEECNIKTGNVVSPDPRSAVYRVVAFRNLKVTAEVSEAYASRVNPGDKVKIFFPDLNRHIDATADFVSKYIDPVNRTFIIESRLKERFPGMKANMIAIIQINDYHSERSISVPINMIQTDHEGSYVYVVKNKDNYHGAFKQPVTIGNTYNGIAEITGGLAVNDKIITTGYQELIDGEYIRIGSAPVSYGGSSN